MTYRYTSEEIEIINRCYSEKQFNWFLRHFLTGEERGTRWRRIGYDEIGQLWVKDFVEKAKAWQAGYNKLYSVWLSLGEPDFFRISASLDARTARAVNEETWEKYVDADIANMYMKTIKGDEYPVFFHRHGFTLLPWTDQRVKSNAKVFIILGGFGSGKTVSELAIQLFYAATIPDYRYLIMAPNSDQINADFSVLQELIEGTPAQRMCKFINHPRHKIEIRNDLVGKSEIIFIPIGDDIKKIRTLTIDGCMIDQGEELDIEDAMSSVMSRMRGQTLRGRKRLGVFTILANSSDEDTLWDLVERSDSDPNIKYIAPFSSDNFYLTVDDLIRYQMMVGADQGRLEEAIYGAKPESKSDYFSRDMVDQCASQELSSLMAYGLREKKPGYILMDVAGLGACRWELPYDPKRSYVTVADPGQSDPPKRNSPVVATFDVTDFNKKDRGGVILVAFHWVFAGGSPEPWKASFIHQVSKYHTVGNCAIDASGWQATYTSDVEGLRMTGMTPVSMNESSKPRAIGQLMGILSRKMLLFPDDLRGMKSQLKSYKLPDKKLRQDIVAMLLVLMVKIEGMYYQILEGDKKVNKASYINPASPRTTRLRRTRRRKY